MTGKRAVSASPLGLNPLAKSGRLARARLSIFSVLSAFSAFSCTDTGVRPTQVVQSADTADQVLYGMQHYITNEGVRRSLVEADTAYVYETNQVANLHKLKVTFFDNAGVQTSVVTSDSGTYLMRGGGMKARGHVVALTPDGGKLTSEHLDYDEKANSISSDLPFVFDRTGQHIEGNAFTSDPDFRNIVTKQPRGSERTGTRAKKPGDGGGILLPGQ